MNERGNNQGNGKKGLMICAWCGADLGEKEGIEGITHGMCPECKAKQLQQMEEGEKAPEDEEARMFLLYYRDGRLDGIQDADRLTNLQLKICMDHQRAIGRQTVFELRF